MPPISTIDFGRVVVSSLSLVPSPPANITAFMVSFLFLRSLAKFGLGNKSGESPV
jgi:hypothetical protein